jgi:hypothetical protein
MQTIISVLSSNETLAAVRCSKLLFSLCLRDSVVELVK